MSSMFFALQALRDGDEAYMSEPPRGALFIDAVLEALPDLIEDRERLKKNVAVVYVSGHLDEYPELSREQAEADAKRAQSRLDKKRRAFAHVECNVEHLRQVIRQYYREVSI